MKANAPKQAAVNAATYPLRGPETQQRIADLAASLKDIEAGENVLNTRHINTKDLVPLEPPNHKSLLTKNGKKTGRPRSKLFRPIYAKKLVEFFDIEPTRAGQRTIVTKNGTTIEEETVIANPMPFLVDFQIAIGISNELFHEWVRDYPIFTDAYKRAKLLQERHLSVNALNNNYNAGFAGLAAKNWLGWKDKTEVEQHQNLTFNVGRGLPAPVRKVIEADVSEPDQIGPGE